MRVDFPVPAEVAFDYLADPRNRAQWQSSLARVEDVTGGPGPGQTWTDVTTVGLRPRMETTTYERPRRWAETGSWRGFAADLTLDFHSGANSRDRADGEHCTVEVTLALRGRGLARVPAALLGLLAPRAVAADLRRAAAVLAGP